MKRFLVILCFSALVILSSSGYKFSSYEVTNATAQVDQFEGIFIFTDSKPVKEFKYLGSPKVKFSWSGFYPELRDKLIKKTKRDFPEANGIIIRLDLNGDATCDAIKL